MDMHIAEISYAVINNLFMYVSHLILSSFIRNLNNWWIVSIPKQNMHQNSYPTFVQLKTLSEIPWIQQNKLFYKYNFIERNTNFFTMN